MKNKTTRHGLLLAMALILASMMLFGCAAGKSAQDSGQNYSAPAEQNAGIGAVSQEEMGYEYSMESPEISASQKLIYTGEIEVETEQFQADYAAVKEQIAAMGGYLSGEMVSGTEPIAYGDSGRFAQITARIPTENFQPFLDNMDGRMEIVHKNVEVDDVTEYYYDNEARIELLETRYAKLEEHLKAAENMEDIITLEKEMSEILSELDALKGTRRHLDHQVEYSTLTIYLNEIVRSSGVTTSKKSVGSRMGEAFSGTLRAIGVFFEDAAIFLVGALPILLMLGAIALVVILCVRVSKKRKEKKMAKPGENAER